MNFVVAGFDCICTHITLLSQVILFQQLSGKRACVASQLQPMRPPYVRSVFAHRKCLLHLLRNADTTNEFSMVIEFVISELDFSAFLPRCTTTLGHSYSQRKNCIQVTSFFQPPRRCNYCFSFEWTRNKAGMLLKCSMMECNGNKMTKPNKRDVIQICLHYSL